MKIALIGDSHLGYVFGSEREEDSFSQFGEALEKAIDEKVDLILLPGDIFDSRVPRQEVLARAFKLFQKPFSAGKTNVRCIQTINREKDFPDMVFNGIPIIAIHGTHERRGAHFINPVETLEKAGFLIHLHKSGIVLEKNGERIAIQGLGGEPEKYVKEILKDWNPKPVEGCKNIFMFHQSLKEYVYNPHETFLTADELPPGFDLYIDGHIHWSNVLERNKRVLFPGSTVITQQREVESQKRKGFFVMDVGDEISYRFIELETQRPFYFEKIKFQNASVDEVVKKSKEVLSRILSKSHAKKPQIKLKLVGSLEKGKQIKNIPLGSITHDFSQNAIISIDREFEVEDFRKRVQELRRLYSKKKSVDEMGMDVVKEMLSETKYSGMDPEKIINLLSDGKTDSMIQKVLEGFKKESS